VLEFGFVKKRINNLSALKRLLLQCFFSFLPENFLEKAVFILVSYRAISQQRLNSLGIPWNCNYKGKYFFDE